MRMARRAALHVALDLAAWPPLAYTVRGQPLPADVLELIRIAAADPEACRRVEDLTGRGSDEVRDAAVAFLQQALFAADSDHYRVLGTERTAPQAILREHFRWLMKWLHPDRTQGEWGSVFAERVLGVWQELKSVDRRARYDRSLGLAIAGERSRQSGHRSVGIRLISGRKGPRRQQRRARQRLAAATLAFLVAVVVLFSSEGAIPPPWEEAVTLTSAGSGQ